MKSSGFVLMALAFMFLNGPDAQAEQLFLTLEDGVSVVLNTDYTWQYEKKGASSSFVGKPITLDDGNTLMLKKDGTWGYITEAKGDRGKPTSGLQSLHATGMAKRSDLSVAGAEAMETALERLAKQLREAMPDLKVSDQVLTECIAAEDKDVESSDDYDGSLYSATIKLALDEMGIRNILHCVETRRKLEEKAAPEYAE